MVETSNAAPMEASLFAYFAECRAAAADPASHWWLRRTEKRRRRAVGLHDYVEEVERTLQRRRLLFQGAPAAWAAELLHEAAADRDNYSWVEEMGLGFFS